MRHGDFEVVVKVADLQLPEYEVQTTNTGAGANQHPISRGAIESVSDATFTVQVKYFGPLTNKYIAQLSLDGNRDSWTGCHLDSHGATFFFSIADGMKRPMKFARMVPIADQENAVSHGQELAAADRIAAVGEIRVDIHQGAIIRRVSPWPSNHHGPSTRQLVLDERQKKAAMISHTIGYGASLGQHYNTCTTKPRRRIGSFVFEYASRDMLIAAGRIEEQFNLDPPPRVAEQPLEVKNEIELDPAPESMRKRRRTGGSSAPSSSTAAPVSASTPQKIVMVLDSDDDTFHVHQPGSESRASSRRVKEPTKCTMILD